MHPSVGVTASAITAAGINKGIDSYVNNLGYVTSPDNPDLTFNQSFCLTMKVLLRNPPNSGANQFLFNHWGVTGGEQSWLLYVTTTGSLSMQIRDSGSVARTLEIMTTAEYAALGTAVPVGLGVKVDLTTRYAALKSTDFTTWAEYGTPKTTTPFSLFLNSTAALGVGCRGGNGADRYGGRVYWANVILGTNPHAAPFIRFDANEHYGKMTTWPDARGRQWNLSGTAGITHP